MVHLCEGGGGIGQVIFLFLFLLKSLDDFPSFLVNFFFFDWNSFGLYFRYHDAGAKAKAKVLDLLRGLSSELQTKINILVFASMLLVISKALFSHVRLDIKTWTIYVFGQNFHISWKPFLSSYCV